MEKVASDYTVGWICALPIEMAAAKAMLDEIHPKLPQPASNDQNSYCLGSINGHNIAIACLPSGVQGTTSAATVASSMLHTFPSIRFGLMVGIGGGVPHKNAAADMIRLGDVVISKPTNDSGGVLQYDLGKSLGNGLFQRTGALNKPPQVLLTALSDLQADHLMGITQIPTFLSQITSKYPTMTSFTYPGLEHDQLFRADYVHVPNYHNPTSCQTCDKTYLITRPARNTTDPRMHYGIIASGNQLIRDGMIRDNLLAQSPDILCLEMEAAGLMDQFPCLVIRGISDYADSHKSDLWQPYAAAVAAAYAKELLSVISARQIWKTTTANQTISAEGNNPLLQLAATLGPSTVLHDAISRGQQDVVMSLLDNDKRVASMINAQDRRGFTPLHTAIEQDDIVSARALIEHGASTARSSVMVPPPLSMAAQLGNEEMVKLLLDKGEANINERDARGYTALVSAAAAGNEKLLMLLIQRGADLNARGGRGGTALHQASMVGQDGTVRILLRAGAKTDIRDISGRTALQLATNMRREKVKRVFAEESG